ncbi:MAG: YfcE family phosphodiesterase [Sphaerochaeta sp.]|jgi:hypothetical protein|uniref:YfcE family phosphodiesterase n=1 Tax=Sphaerochaeta sp. TaxID=1972642 RepID=UPI002FC87906
MASSFLITGDIHGDHRILHMLQSRARQVHAQAILIAGDLTPTEDPVFRELFSQDPPSILVKGNCDTSYSFDQAGITLPPLIQRFQWEGREVVMTHGDRYPSPYGLHMHPGDIFISAHTHVPRIYLNEEGILLINPGSPTYPRSTLGATYAVLETQKASVYRLQEEDPVAGCTYYFTRRSDQ